MLSNFYYQSESSPHNPFQAGYEFVENKPDEPDPVVLGGGGGYDDEYQKEIKLKAISEKKYLPGERLLERLEKAKKRKKNKISEERLLESFSRIVKLF